MSGPIAILAYGSLLDDPGAELEPLIAERQPARTPFRVEFARSSQKRAGAPTLVPVFCEGIGAFVQAQLLVLKHEVSVEQATDMLYRREIHRVGSNQPYDDEKARQSKDGMRIERLEGYAGLDVVLYASLPANLEWICNPRLSSYDKAQRLAELAIKSVTLDTYKKNIDGIYYLEKAIAHGINTPLTALYREAILRKTGTSTLVEARKVALQWNQEEKL
jgi:hypothetical protein